MLWPPGENNVEEGQFRINGFTSCLEGSVLVDAITKKIGTVNIWKSESAVELLQMGISLCDQWIFAVKTLTQLSWKQGADTVWKGDTPKLDLINGFRTRLDQILSLKMLSLQVGQLLNEKNAEREIEDALEGSMKNFNALIYNPYSDPQWKSKLQVIFTFDTIPPYC
ncbi:unnamed protein product [Toxocara canis]|uniref:DHC_N2 domain-containing protein n=1 Tax=Toxocara canis TaxID=6265 RepID=A0A183U7Y6_TOXCA|nr:unnamed protein product [Toxocara canis]